MCVDVRWGRKMTAGMCGGRFCGGRSSLTLIRENLPDNIRYSLIINEIREFLPKN